MGSHANRWKRHGHRRKEKRASWDGREDARTLSKYIVCVRVNRAFPSVQAAREISQIKPCVAQGKKARELDSQEQKCLVDVSGPI